MRKKVCKCVFLVLFALSLFFLGTLWYDPDNIRILKRIYYNADRKDILDYDGIYEIPPVVVDYYKTDDAIFVKWKPDYPIPLPYEKYDYSYSEDSIILYWVIDLKNEKQIGPIDSMKFIGYCNSENIKFCFKK